MLCLLCRYLPDKLPITLITTLLITFSSNILVYYIVVLTLLETECTMDFVLRETPRNKEIDEKLKPINSEQR